MLNRTEELIDDAVAHGVPRDKATRAVLAAVGDLYTASPERNASQLRDPEQQIRDARASEKREQHEISRRFRVCGFKVRSTSQSRASKVAPGLPDLWIVHTVRPIALWWESKRQVGGKYSEAQLEFRTDCERAGVTCLGGDRFDAERYLVSIGCAWITEAGTLEVVR